MFVTPTCPYCPPAVILAQQMAYYSPRVRADMIEATEFPPLAQKYNVYGVPRTVINEKEFIEGAVPAKGSSSKRSACPWASKGSAAVPGGGFPPPVSG